MIAAASTAPRLLVFTVFKVSAALAKKEMNDGLQKARGDGEIYKIVKKLC